jgi:hypothetical protein
LTTIINILAILIAMNLSACSTTLKANQDSSISSKKENPSIAKQVPSDKKETEIVVKNRADYSERFVEGLYHLGFKKIELKDSLLIINEQDTTYFPETPQIGKDIVLTAKKGDLAIAVKVKRINYTSVNYTIEMVEYGKANHKQSGSADIISSFFFGAESDESDLTGMGYFVTEFSEFKNEDCYTSIRLGYEEESGPYLLGKLIKNCNEKIMEIRLDNFPTLIEK